MDRSVLKRPAASPGPRADGPDWCRTREPVRCWESGGDGRFLAGCGGGCRHGIRPADSRAAVPALHAPRSTTPLTGQRAEQRNTGTWRICAASITYSRRWVTGKHARYLRVCWSGFRRRAGATPPSPNSRSHPGNIIAPSRILRIPRKRRKRRKCRGEGHRNFSLRLVLRTSRRRSRRAHAAAQLQTRSRATRGLQGWRVEQAGSRRTWQSQRLGNPQAGQRNEGTRRQTDVTRKPAARPT